MCYCVRAVGITNVLIGLKKNKKMSISRKYLDNFQNKVFNKKCFLLRIFLNIQTFLFQFFVVKELRSYVKTSKIGWAH